MIEIDEGIEKIGGKLKKYAKKRKKTNFEMVPSERGGARLH